MTTGAPYLSVVAVADFDGTDCRAQDFVDSWSRQASQHGLSVELIVATDRNTGISGACGEFVLATHIENRCSDELMAFLASRALVRNRMYRVDRYDGDARVWTREGLFALTPGGLRASESEGIHFESGWFPATQAGRYIGNDAEIVIEGIPQPWAAMDLEVEPGPGVGGGPATLQIVGPDQAVVAQWEIATRTAVRFWAPPSVKSFRIRAPQGGWGTPLDLHIFNFRCLQAEWVEPTPRISPPPPKELIQQKRPTLARFLAAWRQQGIFSLARAPWVMVRVLRLLGRIGADVFGPAIEYWGAGWSYLERDSGESFRWASQEAELVVRLRGPRCNLAMLVEPGPGVGGRLFVLRVQLADGTVVGRAEVRGASYVNIPLPEFQEPIVRLLIGPEGGARAAEGDSRVLGFRVFACSCEVADDAARRESMAPQTNWVTVTRATYPVEIDWREKLREHQAVIAEMGKPEDLHLNACGDFTLMAREHWRDLRGYPELDLPTADLDALLCLAAHHAGIREEVLPPPMCIRRTDDREAPPAPLNPDVVWTATQMRRLRVPALFNAEDWGLKG